MRVVRDRLLVAETGKNIENNRSQIRVTLVSQIDTAVQPPLMGKSTGVPKNYY